jgi:TusA-related sulfurtransferase
VPVNQKVLDISGKVCPYCLLAVKEETVTMKPGDDLVVICDHEPAAMNTIPRFAQENAMSVKTRKLAPGKWELHLIKK